MKNIGIYNYKVMKSLLTKGQKAYLVLKRAIDIFGSLLGIILLSPFLVVCAIVTKATSEGPIIFKQERIGKGLKPFRMYKFRSMYTSAPANLPPEYMTVEEQQSLVTPWGRFMRKTSLDEIPQLFNILKGDMSFIGPRPTPMCELVQVRLSYLPNAYEVKPGLSGYAQIYMHRDHDINEKAKEDSYYVSHMSFWLDFKLFVYSFLVLFGFDKGR